MKSLEPAFNEVLSSNPCGILYTTIYRQAFVLTTMNGCQKQVDISIQQILKAKETI